MNSILKMSQKITKEQRQELLRLVVAHSELKNKPIREVFKEMHAELKKEDITKYSVYTFEQAKKYLADNK